MRMNKRDQVAKYQELIVIVICILFMINIPLASAQEIQGVENIPEEIQESLEDSSGVFEDESDLKSASDTKSTIISTNLMGVDVQQNLYPGSADWSGVWTQSVADSFLPDGTTINGYPAVKGTSAWRSIKKSIPVEAGKTYTFQVYVKAADARDFRVYLDAASNPATVVPTSMQFTGTANNTWRKIELTFSCSASGNIEPCIISAYGGDFYIARYVLVEGNKVFSLADEISNNNQNIESINTEVNASKNTLDEYIYGVDSTFTLTPTSSQYAIHYPIKVGMAFDISIVISGTTSDGGQKNVQLLDDTGVVETYYNSLTKTYKVTRDATFFKFILNNVGTWTGLNAVITVKRSGTMVNGEFPSFTLYKDGTGNFTSLVEAIETTEKYNGATLYIGPGTWDVLAELGDDYLAAVSSSESTWGLVLKNNIHVICSNQTVFTANYTGNNSNVRTYLSVFNAGPNGFTLENARIISSNIRYCVHDDRGSNSDAYNNRYINCNMYHDNSGNTVFGGWQCIGGGFGKNGTITIEHCVFDGLNQYGSDTLGGIISYHNSYSSGAKSKLIVKDCYFGHRTTVRVSWYGSSTEISEAYIIGNNLGYAIDHSAENESATVQNTSVTEWNNIVRE